VTIACIRHHARHTRDNLCATITSFELVCTYELCGRIVVFCIYPAVEARGLVCWFYCWFYCLASHCIAFAGVGGGENETTSINRKIQLEEKNTKKLTNTSSTHRATTPTTPTSTSCD
jgi:hypothetical protein